MTPTVSMGIYVIEPEALMHIPPTGYFDFPDLIHALLKAGKSVGPTATTGCGSISAGAKTGERAASVWAEAEAAAEAEAEAEAAEVAESSSAQADVAVEWTSYA